MKVYAVYFSPTKHTEKIVKILAGEFGSFREIDLSLCQESFEDIFQEEDICFIGVPSYGGRVPSPALERIRSMQGNHARAVIVVSYGNRAYEDTARELAECVEQQGFCCIAGVTAVAEHSIMHQFAAGRPDETDRKELKTFAKKISDKIQKNSAYKKLELPGNFPYREYKGIPLKPKAGKKCIRCGLCARLCPTGAISTENPRKTDPALCISCMRCVELCPNQTRKVNSVLVQLAARKMKAACGQRKQNELFL